MSKELQKIIRGKGNQSQPHRFKSGAYLIKHIPSDLVYVGSTADVSRRESEHFSMLRRGKHSCEPLQRLYDESADQQEFEYLFHPTENREEAFDLEQEWITEKERDGVLVNVAQDARCSTKGREFSQETKEKLRQARLGKPLSKEHAEKQRCQLRAMAKSGEANPSARTITVDGVRYGTIKEAANVLGVEKSTLRNRGLNDNFPNVVLD